MIQLEITRGDSKDFEVRTTINKIAASLFGLAVEFTLKRRLSDSNERAVLHQSVANGGIVLDGVVVGRAVVTVPPEATQHLTRETLLFWDIQVSDTFGAVETIASGTLLVRLDATR